MCTLFPAYRLFIQILQIIFRPSLQYLFQRFHDLLCSRGAEDGIHLRESYTDLMKVVNSEVEPGEAPVVNSRYSIVMATSKRARQLIAGEEPLVSTKNATKPLSIAVEELNQGKIKILSDEEE